LKQKEASVECVGWADCKRFYKKVC